MIEPASPEVITRAGRLIRGGAAVAFPTETVYGLGANACSDTAVAHIFEIMRRPAFNPLIVHVGSFEEAAMLGDFDRMAYALADAFWPGALSIVVPRRRDCEISLLACAGLDTVAIRVPAHKTARAILAAAQCPIAAPSANASGEVSPTLARHVADSLGDALLIVDDGPCPVGLESTVVACSGGQPVILRPGGITFEAIADIAGPVKVAGEHDDGPVQSPGMLRQHYAPRSPVRLEARSVAPGEALLAFGRHEIDGASEELNLSAGGDLTEAAANLFAMLRALDRPEHSAIAVMAIPEDGLGRAINDRLRRASRPGPWD